MCTRGPLRYFSESGELDHIRGNVGERPEGAVPLRNLSLREADPVVSLTDGTAAFRLRCEGVVRRIVCARVSPPLDPVEGGTVDIGEKGYPRISPVVESNVPGLYFCGSLAMFHPRCAFIPRLPQNTSKKFSGISPTGSEVTGTPLRNRQEKGVRPIGT